MNREQLSARALRAYEVGRLRYAAQVALWVVPLSLFAALLSGAHEACLCLGALLSLGAVLLRWRNRRGAQSVTSGLLAGTAPLLVGLVLARLVPWCAEAPLWSVCTALCLGIGAASGAWLGQRVARTGAPLTSTVAATVIAIAAASLGCVQLGLGGLVGVGAGLALGGALVAARRAMLAP